MEGEILVLNTTFRQIVTKILKLQIHISILLFKFTKRTSYKETNSRYFKIQLKTPQYKSF